MNRLFEKRKENNPHGMEIKQNGPVADIKVRLVNFRSGC